MLEQFYSNPGIAIDIETSSTDFNTCSINCIAIYSESYSEVYTEETINKEDLKKLLQNTKLIGHNLGFDLKVLTRLLGISLPEVWFDTMIAAKLLDENIDNDLQNLSEITLKEEHPIWEKTLSLEELERRCLIHAKHSYQLVIIFMEELKKQNLLNLFKLEMSVYNKMTEVEYKGVNFDVDTAKILLNQFTHNLEKFDFHTRKYLVKNKINGISVQRRKKNIQLSETIETRDINFNSPDQLKELLFGKSGYTIIPKYFTKNIKTRRRTERPSTDKNALTEIAERGYRIGDWLLSYRIREKLLEHVEKLVKEQVNGIIYPRFNTLGTETGRMSCSQPNLQQIPKTKAIRNLFTGDLIVADYSNIELRLLASMSGDTNLIQAYTSGSNLHLDTAKRLNLLTPKGELDKTKAKTINFGIIYGIQAKSLARQLKCSIEEAQKLIDGWYKVYPRVRSWQTMIVNTAVKYGYVKDYLDRRRRIDFSNTTKYLPDKFNGGFRISYEWAALEREVVNAVIQGSSASITKLAIRNLKSENIILVVHDEIVIDSPKRSIEEIKDIMEHRIFEGLPKLKVPIEVEIYRVSKWGDSK